MVRNVPLGTVGIVLLSASLLFLWFVVLSGVTDHTPLNKIYFLRADTSDITGARDVTQWTYFFFCGPGNRDCGPARAAPAFGKAWDGRAANVPPSLIGSLGGHTTSFHYYYMWRFGWVFIIIGLFFEVLAWFASFLACCGRLGAAVSSFLGLIALGWLSMAVALMTATFVEARNVFQRNGRGANVGPYAFGFMWAAWTCLFLSTILFCIGIKKGDKSAKEGYVTDKKAGGFTSRTGWRRKRGSPSSSQQGRRVKDEYP